MTHLWGFPVAKIHKKLDLSSKVQKNLLTPLPLFQGMFFRIIKVFREIGEKIKEKSVPLSPQNYQLLTPNLW
jgi:hypothetical protein